MTRRNFMGALVAVAPVTIGDKLRIASQRVPKRPSRILSPKLAAEGSVTPMLKVTASSPSSVRLQAVPGSFAITSLVKSGQSVTVAWQNGVPPFRVEHSTLKVPFTPIGPLTFSRSVTIQDTAGMDTFRVRSYAGDPTASLNNGAAHLKWEVPTP